MLLDFFLLGFVKDYVYQMSMDDVATHHARRMEAIQSMTAGLLTHTWRNQDYQLYMIRTTRGSHVEVH